MSAIQAITDSMLIEAIEKASNRVVIIAPGVWPLLAQAIGDAWQRLGPEQVTVILDVDPEICRIGYGSLEGLKILQKKATALGEALAEEPGIRICVVIVDDQTFVFSPTPRQLEVPPDDFIVKDPSQSHRHLKTNGIVLKKPPTALEHDLGAGPEGFLGRTLGMEMLNQAKLDNVTKDLQRNPAKKFDLSRAVNVYNAKIQFVELKVIGCRLSEHKARLPEHLLHVLKKNPELSKAIENSIRLLEADDILVTDPKFSEQTIFENRSCIDKKFLRPVKGIGSIIERSQKDEFKKEVAKLEEEVSSFAKLVETILSDRFRDTAEKLAKELLEDVLDNIPSKWERKLGRRRDPDQVRWLIFNDLIHAFGDPVKRINKMKVETIFKDVTYDMLNDENFRAEISEYFPDLALVEEYTAARERDSLSRDELRI